MRQVSPTTLVDGNLGGSRRSFPWICAASIPLLLLFSTCPALAHPGWGIVVDREGSVFYTDLKQVWKVTRDGTKTVAVPGVHTHELYLDPAGGLHGEHLWYDSKSANWGSYLWELVDGKVVRQASHVGFRSEKSFVRDPGGAMYWVEGSRIRKRAPSGGVVDVAELPRRPDARGPAAGGILTIADDGTLYLMSGGDLLRVAADGGTARMASGLDEHVWSTFMTQPWHYVMGLTADARGNVYVANSGARKVKKVEPGGGVTVVLSARFPWSPTGVALHGTDLYVLEYADTGGSVRVRRVAPDGRVSALP